MSSDEGAYSSDENEDLEFSTSKRFKEPRQRFNQSFSRISDETMMFTKSHEENETKNESIKEEEEEEETLKAEVSSLLKKTQDESKSNNDFRDMLLQGSMNESKDQSEVPQASRSNLAAAKRDGNFGRFDILFPDLILDYFFRWQSSTKGFGQKFLEKFGLKKNKGRLGKDATGISRQMEVVVRPHGQGLGFGAFKFFY